MTEDKNPNTGDDGEPLEQPLHFEELPFHIKCIVVAREYYSGLSLLNRLTLWFLVAGLLLAPLAFAARPVLREWKRANMLESARGYVAAGDLESAAKAYLGAVRGSRDAARWREYAAFLDEHQIENSVLVWERATDLEPDSAEGWIGFIESAIRSKNVESAVEAAIRTPEPMLSDPAVQAARASAFVLAGREVEAHEAFAAAAAQASTDARVRLALALLALDIGDSAEKAAAHDELSRLMEDPAPTVRIAAMTARLKHARDDNLRVAGIAAAKRLAADPDAPFPLRLDALSALDKWESPDFGVSVNTVGKFAQESPASALSLVQFLLSKGRSAAAAAWVKEARASEMPEANVRRLEAELFLSDGDWEAYVDALADSGILAETPELASRLVEIGQNASRAGALMDWNGALRSVSRPDVALDIPLSIAMRLEWRAAEIATLEHALSLAPANPPVLRRLAARYIEDRNLVGLQRTQERLATLESENLEARNASLLAKLVLGAGHPDANLAEAERILANEPENPSFLTTHAVALYRAGRYREAAAVFAAMKPTDARDPERSLYRGAVLVELGEQEAALRELARADRVRDQLFPELIILLDSARRRAELRMEDVVPPDRTSEPGSTRTNQR